MDVLWRRQTILAIILKTLPADSWSFNGGTFVRRKLTFLFASQALSGFQSLSRDLSQEEWNRFRRYTARVTALSVYAMCSRVSFTSKRPHAWVSLETIQFFAMESQREGFWPRVRSLQWDTGWEATPFISSFLTPTITDLNLSFPHGSSWFLQPTLSVIPHACRQLQSLTIRGPTFGPLSGDEVGCLISASGSTLRSIKITPSTPPEIFPAIFKLPLLRSLELGEPRLPDQIPPEILPPLETVGFTGHHGPNLTRFFGRLSGKKLGEVMVYSHEAIQFPALLESLSGATTVKYLILSPVTTLCRSSIALLCTFTNLTSLSIQCVCAEPSLGLQCDSQPTDQDLLDLGEALPHIRTLDLSPGCRMPCQVTFKSLINLSRTCDCLDYLSVKVDFAGVVENPDQPNDRNVGLGDRNPQRGRSGLQTLDVGNSTLPNAPRCKLVVAVALVSIFPSIKYILSETIAGWDEVQENVLVCQGISYSTQAGSERLSMD